MGSQGLRGTQSTSNLFVVTKRFLSTASSSDGRLVQTPLWFLYPFAVCSARVSSARLRSACFPTNISSALLQAAWFAFHSMCLMLNISATSSNHISSSVVAHVIRFSSQRRVRIVSNALVIFLHIFVASWSAFAAVCIAGDCSPFSASSTCLMTALQPANVMAMLSSRLRVAFKP